MNGESWCRGRSTRPQARRRTGGARLDCQPVEQMSTSLALKMAQYGGGLFDLEGNLLGVIVEWRGSWRWSPLSGVEGSSLMPHVCEPAASSSGRCRRDGYLRPAMACWCAKSDDFGGDVARIAAATCPDGQRTGRDVSGGSRRACGIGVTVQSGGAGWTIDRTCRLQTGSVANCKATGGEAVKWRLCRAPSPLTQFGPAAANSEQVCRRGTSC